MALDPEDDFEAKLAEAGAVEGEDGAAAPTESADADKGLQDGDLKEGTGIWEHDNSAPINYESLVQFYSCHHRRFRTPPLTYLSMVTNGQQDQDLGVLSIHNHRLLRHPLLFIRVYPLP